MVGWLFGGFPFLLSLTLGCAGLIAIRRCAREPHRFWGPFYAQSAATLAVIVAARKIIYTYVRLNL